MKDLKTVLSDLHISEDYLETIRPNWDLSMESMSLDFPIYLTEKEIRENTKYCRLDETYVSQLIDTANDILNNDSLRSLSWHCYNQLYIAKQFNNLSKWPILDQALKEKHGCFYLLIALGVTPFVRSKHLELKIPEKITKDTLLQISCFNLNHLTAYSVPGVLPRQLGWLSHYQAGTLFRLGRLEYKLEPFPERHGLIFKRKNENIKVMLSNAGIKFNFEGFVDGIHNQFDANGWTSEYEEADLYYKGIPINPKGVASKRVITLNKDSWIPYLVPGNRVIDLHIPAGRGLTPEACKASFLKAIRFFSTYFPNQKAKAFYCGSWIFNPLFEDKMATSNLARFMKEQYLFPIPSTGKDGFSFVFCKEYEELSKAPRKTTLHKVMLEQLESGQPLRSGGMLFFTEDIHLYNQSCYRKMWDSLHRPAASA